LGIFLGYSRTLKVMYYFDTASSLVKTATHARFDEGMNDLVDDAPPQRPGTPPSFARWRGTR
jgi:hypothetical protein